MNIDSPVAIQDPIHTGKEAIYGWVQLPSGLITTSYSFALFYKTDDIDTLINSDNAVFAEDIDDTIEKLNQVLVPDLGPMFKRAYEFNATYSRINFAGLKVTDKKNLIAVTDHPFIDRNIDINTFCDLVKSHGSITLTEKYNEPHDFTGAGWRNENGYTNTVIARQKLKELGVLVGNAPYVTYIYDKKTADEQLLEDEKKRLAAERRLATRGKRKEKQGIIDIDTLRTLATNLKIPLSLRIHEHSRTTAITARLHFRIDISFGYIDFSVKRQVINHILQLIAAYNLLAGKHSYRRIEGFQAFKSIWKKKTASAIGRSGLSDALIELMNREKDVRRPPAAAMGKIEIPYRRLFMK